MKAVSNIRDAREVQASIPVPQRPPTLAACTRHKHNKGCLKLSPLSLPTLQLFLLLSPPPLALLPQVHRSGSSPTGLWKVCRYSCLFLLLLFLSQGHLCPLSKCSLFRAPYPTLFLACVVHVSQSLPPPWFWIFSAGAEGLLFGASRWWGVPGIQHHLSWAFVPTRRNAHRTQDSSIATLLHLDEKRQRRLRNLLLK